MSIIGWYGVILLAKIFLYIYSIAGVVLISIGFLKLKTNKTLSIFLIVFGFFLLGFNYYKIYKETHRFVPQNKEAIKKADFNIYIPKYRIKGTKLSGTSMGNPRDPSKPYLSIGFSQKGFINSEAFVIHEFKPDKPLNPPADCGPYNHELGHGYANRCFLLTTTPKGYEVYKSHALNDIWVEIDGTRISSLSLGQYDTEEIVRFIDSLELTPPDKVDFSTPINF